MLLLLLILQCKRECTRKGPGGDGDDSDDDRDGTAGRTKQRKSGSRPPQRRITQHDLFSIIKELVTRKKGHKEASEAEMTPVNVTDEVTEASNNGDNELLRMPPDEENPAHLARNNAGSANTGNQHRIRDHHTPGMEIEEVTNSG